MKRTAGCSGPEHHWSNAERNGIMMHPTPLDIPYMTCQDMLSLHLKWDDPPRSEFLSWTRSLVFAAIHAIGRYEKGQSPAIIAWGMASELQTPDGKPANFHSAIELHKAYDVLGREWRIGDAGLLHGDQRFKLLPHKFTPNHEMRHVELSELCAIGFYYLYPELDVRGVCERTGLYEGQMSYRRGMFYNVTGSEVSIIQIVICENIAKLFQQPGQEKAPLHLVFQLLALRKRMPQNNVFRS